MTWIENPRQVTLRDVSEKDARHFGFALSRILMDHPFRNGLKKNLSSRELRDTEIAVWLFQKSGHFGRANKNVIPS